MSTYYVAGIPYSAEDLCHFGIKGQRWGIRRFQNPDGSLTPEGKRRYGTKENFENKIAYEVAREDYAWDPNGYHKLLYDKAREAYKKTLKDTMDVDLDQLEKDERKKSMIAFGATFATMAITTGALTYALSK